jgi:hypothetical protein
MVSSIQSSKFSSKKNSIASHESNTNKIIVNLNIDKESIKSKDFPNRSPKSILIAQPINLFN